MRNVVVVCGFAVALISDASAEEQGLASFFRYSRAAGLTAAHRTLPLGSQVRVRNLDNGRSVVVQIVGRGPFIHSRVIDVSTEAAAALGFQRTGLAHVRIDSVSAETPSPTAKAATPPADEICRYGAGWVMQLQSSLAGDDAARLEDQLGCRRLRPQLFGQGQSPSRPARAAAAAPWADDGGLAYRRFPAAPA
jgi:rare lipoprotein A